MEMKKRDYIIFLWDGCLNRCNQRELFCFVGTHLGIFPPVATFRSYKLPTWHKCPFKERFNSPKQIDLDDITSREPMYHILTSWHFWVDDASLYLIRPPHRQDVRSSCAGVFRSMSCTLGLADVQVNLVPIRSMGLVCLPAFTIKKIN